MRLLRVQVPEFRALKDVNISFEPDFTPQVFPLGSLNGGGKSTLLQLIFILLSPQNEYTENFFSTLNYNGDEIKVLATITLWDDENNENYILEYFYSNASKIHTILDDENFNPDKKLVDFIKFKLNYNILALFHFNYEFNKNEMKCYNAKEYISKKIFLISPSHQPYIFLSREERRLLFTTDYKNTYEQSLQALKNKLANFYTYDFINQLKNILISAAYHDREMILDTGTWGEKADNLIKTVNSFFVDGKKIKYLTHEQKKNPELITEITFTLPSGQEIYFEDLSHGELKRLAVFVLLKHRDAKHNIENSIVLMDEIENGFHLDWQYTIVRNLVEWGKNNQYILATHSYELCTAVTPAHVKEIEPKLTTK